MEMKLILVKGEPKGKEIVVVKTPTVIGRDPECDVVIASPKVSRKHCRIEAAGAGMAIVDLKSGNGTMVNGEKIDKAVLSPGDKVQIGQLGFIVEIDGNRGAGAPAASAGDTRGDLNDFLASLEAGGKPAKSGGDDEDILQLTDDDLT